MQIYNPKLLAEKSALVTGASKGIGRQCALSLAATGATVTAMARNADELASLERQAASLSGSIIPLAMDAMSSEFISFIQQSKPYHILVNNLGSNQPEPFTDIEEATLMRILDINIASLFRITQAVVKNLLACKQAASIINMSSQMGHIGSPNRTLYCATKHAVEGLTKALAIELAEQSIRVNSVAPTFIKTPMTAAMLDKPEFRDFVLEKIPMKIIGDVEDVANAVVYLASDASKLVTGACIKVDGGWTAQ